MEVIHGILKSAPFSKGWRESQESYFTFILWGHKMQSDLPITQMDISCKLEQIQQFVFY
jgi:hypothetical protein